MNLSGLIKTWWRGAGRPLHLRHGELGERAAKKYLQRGGLKFLTANFRSPRGEMDLIFRDGDCLVFVEVKTRSSTDFGRPFEAINVAKRKLISRGALAWLQLLDNPDILFRFDVVEIVLADEGKPRIELLRDAFKLPAPYLY